MTAKEYIEKAYREHPWLKEKVKEVEKLWGGEIVNLDLVIEYLLAGDTPEQILKEDIIDP